MTIHTHFSEEVKSPSEKKPSALDCPRNLAHEILLHPTASDAIKAIYITCLQRPKKDWNPTHRDADRLGMSHNTFDKAIAEGKKLGWLSRTQGKKIRRSQKKGLTAGKQVFDFAETTWNHPKINPKKRGTYSIVHSNWPDLPWKTLPLFCRVRAYGDDAISLSELVEAVRLDRRTVQSRLKPVFAAGLLYQATAPRKGSRSPETWISASEEKLTAKIQAIADACAAKKGVRSAAKNGVHHPGQVITQDSFSYQRGRVSSADAPHTRAPNQDFRKDRHQTGHMADKTAMGAGPSESAAGDVTGRSKTAPRGAGLPKNSAQKVSAGLRVPPRRRADDTRWVEIADEDMPQEQFRIDYVNDMTGEIDSCADDAAQASGEWLRKVLKPLEGKLHRPMLYGQRLGSLRALVAYMMARGKDVDLNLAMKWLFRWTEKLIEKEGSLGSWQPLIWKVHNWGASPS